MGWIPNLWHREEISFFVQFQHGGTWNNYEVVITRNSYDDSRSRVPGAEQNKGNLEGEDLNAFLVATARTRLKDPAAEPSDDVSRIFRKSGRGEGHFTEGPRFNFLPWREAKDPGTTRNAL